MKDTSFCSSSSFKRRWNKGGKEVNHFIADKEVWAASYVLAKTTTIADMYATICCIDGDNDAKLSLYEHKAHIDYVVITGDDIKKTSSTFPHITS